MNEATAAYVIDRSLYYPGRTGVMKRRVRKYQDRPALAVGEAVTVLELRHVDNGYGGGFPRVKVESEHGTVRWIDAVDVEYNGEPLEIRGW